MADAHQIFDAAGAAERHPRGSRVCPLSFAEQRLWLLAKLEPEKPTCNVYEALRLKGRLNRTALLQSVNEVVKRHDTLRSTFTEIDGNPVRIVAPSFFLNIDFQDLTSLPVEEAEKEAMRRATDEANRTFDLENGPLIRLFLFQIAPDEHFFLISVHQIISDRRSIGVLFREVSALYSTYEASQPSPLSHAPIQYRDYVASQHERLQGETRDQLLKYWKAQLEGAPVLLDLPSDRRRPPQQSYLCGRESSFLPASLKQSLNAFSRQEGVPLFMTVFAAFAVLLYRYARTEDLVLGVLADRDSPETHDLIGLLTNTLVIRVDLSGDPSFRELVGRVRRSFVDAHAHQDLPFELLIDALNRSRSPAYSPLVQVMFVHQDDPSETLHLSGVEASPLSLEIHNSMFDLTLLASDQPDGIHLSFDYATDLFDRATVQGWLRHFEILLTGAMLDTGQHVSEVPLLTGAERHRIVDEWNRTAAEYPSDVPLQELVEAQVRSKPDAIAVVCGDQSLTYNELNARANQLAAYLRTVEVGAETLVGVCLERSVDLIVALFAIIKTGGAYLPLDPRYPDDRIAYLAKESRIEILLGGHELRRRLPDFRGRVVPLDWTVLGRYGTQNHPAAVNCENLAYVLYTSGSTGWPKGVAIARKALINLLWSMRTWFGFTPADVLLGVTTVSFDTAGVDIWLPLLVGARVVLAARKTTLDGSELQSEIERHGVTFLQATPVTWKLLLDSGWHGQADLQAVCTGEAMPQELARRLLPLVGRLWNMYGPTETTIWSTGCPIENPDQPILIGRPIANTQVYILDGNLAPVPIGVSGELCISGDGLARGYLYQEALTAQSFVVNRFCTEPISRIYKTGDLARYWTDGSIEWLGRIDQQIKLRGFRVEPEEIRAALTRHPSIIDCVAVLEKSPVGESYIGAYVVPQGNEHPDTQELREFLRRSLPDHMLPSAFVFLDSLPLTPNGKLDRRALPPLGVSQTKKEFLEPQNDLEVRLRDIWEAVLGLRPISIHDDYFDLGGHSLQAVRVFSEIKKRVGVELPLATLYQAPTIESLARIVAEGGRSELWAAVVPINQTGRKRPLFCVSGLGGGVLTFRNLAASLGPDQPFYALQPRREGSDNVPVITIRAMAAHYIEAIREVQPEGPYCISGYSLGGLVAFEMARQLTNAGHSVAFLGLIDTTAPLRAERSRMKLFPRRTQGTVWRRMVQILSASDRFSMIKDIIAKRSLVWRERLARILHRPVPPELKTLEGSQRFAAWTYRGQAYHGLLTLFRSNERPENEVWSYTLGWEHLAARIDVRNVAGDHVSIYSAENIGTLASELKSCLDQLEFQRAGAASH